MATRNRPRAAKDTLGQEAARLRRGAPGKQFIGERASQSRTARRQELDRVVQMAEEHHREELREASVTDILVELFVDSLRLASSLITAPFRILEAVRRAQKAGA
jgi:hypothetical protein